MDNSMMGVGHGVEIGWDRGGGDVTNSHVIEGRRLVAVTLATNGETGGGGHHLRVTAVTCVGLYGSRLKPVNVL